MANTVEVVGGLGSATDSDVLEGVTYTSDNGIKRSGTFSPTAEHINYDGTSSGLLGTSVQAAIDEVSHQLAIKSDIDHTHEIDDVSGLSDRFTALSDEIGSKAGTEHDHDSKYDPKDSAKIALESAKSYTDEKIATIPTPNVSGQIDIHNNSSTAHADIRSEISEITNSIPTKVSELTNDKGYITGYTETDPTVPAWAKSSTKPSYTYSEVGAAASSHTHEEYASLDDFEILQAEVENTVKITPQTLTDAQKIQARENIDAVSNEYATEQFDAIKEDISSLESTHATDKANLQDAIDNAVINFENSIAQKSQVQIITWGAED